MNPMAHADMLGTIFLPIMGFLTGLPVIGWAKPVPVDERNLKDPRRDMFWVASAGPLSNLLLAFIGALLRTLILIQASEWAFASAAVSFLNVFMIINLSLAFFNLIPVHPLDGGKVIARFLPRDANRFLEDNQSTISMALLILMMVGGLRFLSIPVMWTLQLYLNVSEKILLW
jgi:Zn-dependent protease